MSTSQLTPAAARWLGRHHGVATSAELRRHGVSRKATERLRLMGVLVRHARGVYVWQSTKISRADRRWRDDGITVASWPRLAFDSARHHTPLDHRSVVEQMRDRRLVSDDELLAVGARLCHPARRGTATYRLTMLALGHRPQDSHPEVILADALLRRGVPVVPQWELNLTGEVPTHPDLAVPEARWGVELDIFPEHRSVEGAQRDARRMRSRHRGDWQTEPVTELDMVDVEALADELAALYWERVRAIGGLKVPTGVAQPSDLLGCRNE